MLAPVMAWSGGVPATMNPRNEPFPDPSFVHKVGRKKLLSISDKGWRMMCC